jgi:predicted DNA-binding transcriptional regulator AlpA
MAKVERVMQLIGLMRNRQVVSVNEMAQACGVSQRTIYRYLNTLNRLDVPTNYPQASDAKSNGSPAGLDRDDLEMVDFCLSHNSLTKYPYFAERLGRIRRVFDRQRGALDEGQNLIRSEATGGETLATHESDMLERFTRARTGAKLIEIRTTDAPDEAVTYRPKAIRITGSGASLMVTDPESGEVEIIDLSRVASLTVAAEHANRMAAQLAERSER